MYHWYWMHPHPFLRPFPFFPFWFGPWGLIVLLVWVLLVGFPIGRILSRIGWSPWLAILAFIPLVNLIALWILATSKWPIERRTGG
jgi:hypothetical protein